MALKWLLLLLQVSLMTQSLQFLLLNLEVLVKLLFLILRLLSLNFVLLQTRPYGLLLSRATLVLQRYAVL